MYREYKHIWVLFAAILAVIFAGFFESYFSMFPRFENVSIFHHFHTVVFLLWFVVLFIQPYLMKKGKMVTHRIIGKATYILVPLLVISIFTVTKAQYYRELKTLSPALCIEHLLVPLAQLILFVAFYLLAVIHKKNTGYHVRYIIGTSLILIGPGLGRFIIAWQGLSFSAGVQFCFLITEMVIVGLILLDIRNKKRYFPYSVLLAIFFICHMAWYAVPQSLLWQITGRWFVDVFFKL
jgi:hypothetical protein